MTDRLRAIRGREQMLLIIGALLLATHVINHTIADEAIDTAPTVITSALVVVTLLYRILPSLITFAVAAFAGISHTIGGIAHIVELVAGDPRGGDYTGPFSTLGSLLVLAVAASIAIGWVDRRRQPATGAV